MPKIFKIFLKVSFIISVIIALPFVALYLTKNISIFLNNLSLNFLVENYSKFEHPITSESASSVTAFVDSIIGNGDHFGPCVMNVYEIRRTSVKESNEAVKEKYFKSNKDLLLRGYSKYQAGYGFYILFPEEIEKMTWKKNSPNQDDQITYQSYKRMKIFMENNPINRYYLVNFSAQNPMRGLDRRCIIL